MPGSPPRFVEELLNRSGDVLVAYGPARLSSEVIAEMVDTIAELATPEERDAGRIYRTGPDAGEFIEAALSRWTRAVIAGKGWSGAKSLYLLRRLPMNLLAELVMGIDASDERLTACIVGTERLLIASLDERPAQSEEVVSIDGTVAYHFSDDELISFMRRVVATSHLWLMQNTARIVGKGCDVAVRAGHVPEAVETPGLRHALDVYDTRSRHIDEIGIAGSRIWRPADERTSTTISWWGHRNPLSAYYGELQSDEVASRAGRVSGREQGRTAAGRSDRAERYPIQPTHIALPFEQKRFDLALMGQLTSALEKVDADWYEPELPGVLALLHALDGFEDEVARFQIEHSGYLRMDRGRLFDLLNENSTEFRELVAVVLPGAETNPRKLMSQLLRVRGCVYPTVDGPVVTNATSGELMVDVVTASRRLVWLLTLTSHGGGRRAQARGGHFESLVRSEIDRAGFGPRDPSLAQIVGRQLKRDRDFITDIDAIADLGDGTILLVSAKSYPYTPEYASGRYAAVNAVTSKVLKDIATWEDRLLKLLAVPEGPRQNFQLPSRNYVGVLITPFAPFLPPPECDREAMPGLRRTGSLEELTNWLSQL